MVIHAGNPDLASYKLHSNSCRSVHIASYKLYNIDAGNLDGGCFLKVIHTEKVDSGSYKFIIIHTSNLHLPLHKFIIIHTSNLHLPFHKFIIIHTSNLHLPFHKFMVIYEGNLDCLFKSNSCRKSLTAFFFFFLIKAYRLNLDCLYKLTGGKWCASFQPSCWPESKFATWWSL